MTGAIQQAKAVADKLTDQVVHGRGDEIRLSLACVLASDIRAINALYL